jgi:hypothetical protein
MLSLLPKGIILGLNLVRDPSTKFYEKRDIAGFWIQTDYVTAKLPTSFHLARKYTCNELENAASL